MALQNLRTQNNQWGRLFFINYTGEVFGYNLENGKELWPTSKVKGSVLASPMLFDKRLYVLSSTARQNFLYSFSIETGGSIFEYQVGEGSVTTSPSLYSLGQNPLIFMTDQTGRLFLIDAYSGGIRSEIQVGVNINSSGAIDVNGNYFFIDVSGFIHGFNGPGFQAFNRLYQLPGDNFSEASIALSGSTLLIPSSNYLYALEGY